MKHSDWLRLQSDSAALASLRASGDCICANLRQHGYQCRKQTRRLSWKLSKEGQEDYILTFAPSPIADWSLIPNETSSARTQLWQLIENTLNRIRGEIKTTSSQHLSQAEDYSRPWAIIRLLRHHDPFISPSPTRSKIPHHRQLHRQIAKNSQTPNCARRMLGIRPLRPSH